MAPGEVGDESIIENGVGQAPMLLCGLFSLPCVFAAQV
jgi:hypothetical protein